MRVIWLTPLAWWGLAALALPVAIHLLTRQQTRRFPFPTLRFLRPTRLAALRRRSIHDWPLLLVRLAILAAATGALAGPVFVSAARQAHWQTRVAQAFIVAPSSPAGAADVVVGEEARESFASAVFRPPTTVADGVRDAIEWLERQPPAAREVVIAGDLREGQLDELDLSLVPSTVGLRFLPTPPAALSESRVELPFAHARFLSEGTHVTYREPAANATEALSVRSARADASFAEAARQAILARGIRRDRALARRVVVVFDGADVADLDVRTPAASSWMRETLARLPGMTGGQAADLLVVRVPRRANDLQAAHAIDRIAGAVFAEDLRAFEPRRIPPATLAQWSRRPAPDPDAPVSDEGDRRWLWALALVFLGLETVARRARSAPAGEPAIKEQRIA